jgi:GNAT superfamily N-acetyltransferase
MQQELTKTDIISEILKTAEEYFGTSEDVEQIPATQEALERNLALHPKSFIYKTTEDNKLIGWVTVLPTSKKLAEDFLSNKITERELLYLTSFSEEYEALYFCSAFILPEHRRKGYSFKMFMEAIEWIPCVPDQLMFAWPITLEGEMLIAKLEQFLNVEIKVKQ